ncbi:MAG: hypothetical protein E6H79_20195 [Betaproteobacteria bacterium]|nr:MAG: hypothetical protein E6H79_20195 [Betaproteobacteria bacterium]
MYCSSSRSHLSSDEKKGILSMKTVSTSAVISARGSDFAKLSSTSSSNRSSTTALRYYLGATLYAALALLTHLALSRREPFRQRIASWQCSLAACGATDPFRRV